MKKVFSLVLVFMLLASSFSVAFANEAKTTVEKLATVVWDQVFYNYFGEQVTLRVTLAGAIGNQLDEYRVEFEEYNIKYLDSYEDNPEYFEEVVVDGNATYKWNGKGDLVDDGVIIIPVASGATLTIEVLDGKTSFDFYPGYYSFIDEEKKVLVNGMGQAYEMTTGSPKIFVAELEGNYDDRVYEFPLDLYGLKLGLLIVDPETYPLPGESNIPLEKTASQPESKI